MDNQDKTIWPVPPYTASAAWFYMKSSCGSDTVEQNQKPSATLYIDEIGVKWIRIKAIDEDFSLSLCNIKNGDKDKFMWGEAMEFAQSQGQELPSKKQWMLIDILRDIIDNIIKDSDGEPLNKTYWSKSGVMSNGISSWLYTDMGALAVSFNSNSFCARTIINHKNHVNVN